MEQDKTVLDNILNNVTRLWVFGYGSILWKTGFTYESKKIGYINGYARRFWQGSTSHRGTPENPGRVATLVPEESGEVWGAAYELVGASMIREALDHLGVRECLLGGYITVMTPFQPRDANLEPYSVLMFTATEENSLFVGPSSLNDLAKKIISCKGPCGHNIQYVTFLGDYMKEHIPEETDTHLFGLIDAIIRNCEEQGLDMTKLINEAKHNHPSKSSVCSKCNALCSEYAFCSKCRAETIQDALLTGSSNCSKSTSHNRSKNKSKLAIARKSDVMDGKCAEVELSSGKRVKVQSNKTEILIDHTQDTLMTAAAE